LTRTLVDLLGIREVASIGVKFYKGINERLEEPEIYQDLPVSVAGEKVLLLMMWPIQVALCCLPRDYLASIGVDEVTTATLFYKPHSKIKTRLFWSSNICLDCFSL
jgi:hypothetical protein